MVGSAGSGKTYGAKSVVAQILRERKAAGLVSRLIVFTSKNDWRVKGAVHVWTRRGLIRAMLADRFPIIVRGIFHDWPPLEIEGLVCVFDEAHRLRHERTRLIPRAIAVFCREGRDPQTAEWIAASQRPADLSADFKANLTHALIYPLTDADDRKWVRNALGVKIPAKWLPVDTPGGTRYLPFLWDREGSSDSENVQAAEPGGRDEGRRRRS